MSPAVTTNRTSLQNILFATDFSASSDTALRYAIHLSGRYCSTLYTGNVVPEELSDVQPPDPFHLRHAAKKNIANLLRSDAFAGIKHRELLREGEVSRVLSELIEELDIDLVVLGTHGRGGVQKFLIGSVAEEIAGFAPCPVLMIGPNVFPKSVSELKLRRILCATDLLQGSTRAITYALWLAEHEYASLTLVHVLKGPVDVLSNHLQLSRDIALKRLAQLLPSEVPASVKTDLVVEIGAPAQQILRIAEARRADLVVIGPHHTSYTRLSTHLPWVAPHQVLCHAHCPVLTVRS